MSRSRRKTPIVGHTTCRSEREDKKLWHQRWRTHERTALASASPEALCAHLPLLENQVSNVWSMGKDGRSYWPIKRQAATADRIANHKGRNPQSAPPEKASAAQVDEQMNLSTIEALAIAWARIAEEAELPAGYEGTATPEAHRACEVIQERIREHVVATNDMRLFGLLHLLGQASLRMEQALWPEEYARMTREVEEALREADDPNAKSYTHEEVMQAMQERIDRARDKAMLIG